MGSCELVSAYVMQVGTGKAGKCETLSENDRMRCRSYLSTLRPQNGMGQKILPRGQSSRWSDHRANQTRIIMRLSLLTLVVSLLE